MAVGLPAKTTYVDGDVFSASDINDTNGTVNLVGQELNYYAGKNKIINGDFTVNQRGFSSTTAVGDIYGFDRWFMLRAAGGTVTYSAQTFTPGTAPVSGYEAKNFARIVTESQSATSDRATFVQRLEDVRTFAGQTVTVSFYAKAATGTPNISVEMAQNFGTGGSPSASVTAIGASQIQITSSWARYSKTISVPSISGKTVGTTTPGFLNFTFWISAGSDFNTRSASLGNQNVSIDFWGVQMEAGSTATAFQTATGTIQGELAACQRYYNSMDYTTGKILYLASAYSSTLMRTAIFFPVQMRISPTFACTNSTNAFYLSYQSGLNFFSTMSLVNSSVSGAGLQATVSGVTGGTAANIEANTTVKLEFSSEL